MNSDLTDFEASALKADALSQWEKAAQTNWGRYITQAEERVILQTAAAVKQPALVLDNGCGEGRWTNLLRKQGWQAICTDIDPVALEKCRIRNLGATCVLQSKDDRRLPADTGSVDLILCVEVPGVLESGWFQQEAQRVLKADGIIIGIFHNRKSLRGWLRSRSDAASGSFCFYRMSFSDWRRQIGQHDLKVSRAEGLCWFPFRRTSNSGWIPLLTRLEQLFGLRAWITFSPWVLFVAQKGSSAAPS